MTQPSPEGTETPAQDTPPATEPPKPTEPAQPARDETNWKAEARKWEQRAKENSEAAKKLAKFEDEKKSAEQRAQDAATAAEKRATEALHRVASAEVRAALTGVVTDPSAIVEDLNLSRFITSEGEVDSEAIGKLREKYAAFSPQQPKSPKPNPAQGSNGSKPHEGQLTHEDMKRMSPEQIVEAQSKGLFDVALGIKK